MSQASYRPASGEALAIIETSGPTTLPVGAVADGQFLKRVGATIVGAAGGGSGGTGTWEDAEVAWLVTQMAATRPKIHTYDFAASNNTGAGNSGELTTSVAAGGSVSFLDGDTSPSIPGGAIRQAVSATNSGSAQVLPVAGVGTGTVFIAKQTDSVTKKVGVIWRGRLNQAIDGGASVAGWGWRGSTIGNYAMVGAHGPTSSTKYAAILAESVGASASAVSTISIDTAWHTFALYSDGTNFYLSVDHETPVQTTGNPWITTSGASVFSFCNADSVAPLAQQMDAEIITLVVEQY